MRFAIPAPESVTSSNFVAPVGALARYRLKGHKGLRPTSLRDDGEKTYIEWAPDQPLPAVFSINALGEEETVDGYMRGGVMVIDRVYPALVFRIGKLRARAERQTGNGGRAN